MLTGNGVNAGRNVGKIEIDRGVGEGNGILEGIGNEVGTPFCALAVHVASGVVSSEVGTSIDSTLSLSEPGRLQAVTNKTKNRTSTNNLARLKRFVCIFTFLTIKLKLSIL
jgi:hypothetical protein